MNLQYGLLNHLLGEMNNDNFYIYMLILFGVLLFAYFIGSINPAIIVSTMIYHDDVRTKGSGNAGMTNMFRNFGFKGGMLTLLGDLIKTVFAVLLGGFLFGFRYIHGISFSQVLYVIGMVTVLGHVFPVYYGFKGGKGVLATASMALILTPGAFVLLFPIFVGVVLISKFVSLGSVLVLVLYPVVVNGYIVFIGQGNIHTPPLIALTTIFLAVLTVWCHRENLKRIGLRTENKISFGKGKKKEEEAEAEAEAETEAEADADIVNDNED